MDVLTAEPKAASDQELSEWISRSKIIDSLEKLPGDASTRVYYRLKAEGKTYIVMRTDPFAEHGEKYPFIAVQGHLAAQGIDVPEIVDRDAGRGLILLEDLGDITLLRRLQEVSDSEVERKLYEKVIDSLVLLQLKASPRQNNKSLEAFGLRFDREKLMWEVGFCISHFYEKYLKRNLAKEDLAIMNGGFEKICTFLADQPTVLTHRDFHSRNIMVSPAEKGERLVMIDFQDARMGPAQYDLASLLKDSYYQLAETQISGLLDYYVTQWEAHGGKPLDRAEFTYVFDMMSVQRNFKAIGSFASFLNNRGNATYLKYIGNTFENIRRTLLKYPEFAQLREVLFHYYYF